MNRQIKFRGKRLDNGEWFISKSIDHHENGKVFLKQYANGEDEHGAIGWHTYIEINPKTLGEYTGLKDKNGKEIYESDVLKYIDHPTGINSGHFRVEFESGCFGMQSNTWVNLYETEPHKWCEIIGNIHKKKP